MAKRATLLILLMAMTFGVRAITVTDTLFNRSAHEQDFAFGADVSFVPQMEGWGTKWLDKNGQQKDILQILKEQGINSVRLRVWTVGSGASSKSEVVGMCKRAKAKGMSVMIDFHYSDTWADPGNQTIPSAWTDHSVEALAQHVYDHTKDVLSAIKAAGVVPKWVQVGNETKRGMLYPVGQTNKGGSVAFAKFVQAGYDAVKAVDSTMQVIVHLPDGHDNSLYRSIFDGLKKNGAKWDIIGLSAYPRWSHLDGPTMITKVMANINDLKSRYKTPCMVVETGHYPKEAVVGNQYLAGVMDKMIKNGDLGCFYWEPESMGGYDMGAWDEATRRPTVMMDAFLGVKHTEVSWMMKVRMLSPTAGQSVDEGVVELQTRVQHQRKNRIQSVEFHLDKKKAGTFKAEDMSAIGSTATIPFVLEDVPIGVHTAWAKATDTSKNTQVSDTVTFFVGRSALLDEGIVENGEQKGGIERWGMAVTEAGAYRLEFQYGSPALRGGELRLNGDSISKIYFQKNANAHQSFDIVISEPGSHLLELVATSATGLPLISSLRVFPLEGQALPTAADVTGVGSRSGEEEDAMMDVYTLGGVLVRQASLSQLGISLGRRSSAVVVLPNWVGGTPYIVRKHRLK